MRCSRCRVEKANYEFSKADIICIVVVVLKHREEVLGQRLINTLELEILFKPVYNLINGGLIVLELSASRQIFEVCLGVILLLVARQNESEN